MVATGLDELVLLLDSLAGVAAVFMVVAVDCDSAAGITWLLVCWLVVLVAVFSSA